MTEAQFVCKFEEYLQRNFRTHTAAAEFYNISRSKLYGILSLDSHPTEHMLSNMGLKRTVKITVTYSRAGK